MTVTLKPDFYDGCPLLAVDKDIRAKLSDKIIPSKRLKAPILPNFTFEVKASGLSEVVRLPVCANGAAGERGMCSWINYPDSESSRCDGNAHTASATCHNESGVLSTYLHHTTTAVGGGCPVYHMNLVDSNTINHW
jgi:hypothetical protein